MNRPIYFEVLSENPEALLSFYESVFGWSFARGGDAQAYFPCTTGEQGMRGIDGGFMGQHFGQAVINTIEVESIDDCLQRVQVQGGRTLHGPERIEGVGRHAYCADPQGVIFGVIESETMDG